MSPDILALLIPIFAIVGGITLGGVRMLIKHKERLAELGGGYGPSHRELEARLTRLEQSMETMSLEIERNGEAQRYLTKVLAKHLPAEAQEQLPK
jgi:uncharacterized coiled-coil DUF342 family protein